MLERRLDSYSRVHTELDPATMLIISKHLHIAASPALYHELSKRSFDNFAQFLKNIAHIHFEVLQKLRSN